MIIDWRIFLLFFNFIFLVGAKVLQIDCQNHLKQNQTLYSLKLYLNETLIFSYNDDDGLDLKDNSYVKRLLFNKIEHKLTIDLKSDLETYFICQTLTKEKDVFYKEILYQDDQIKDINSKISKLSTKVWVSLETMPAKLKGSSMDIICAFFTNDIVEKNQFKSVELYHDENLIFKKDNASDFESSDNGIKNMILQQDNKKNQFVFKLDHVNCHTKGQFRCVISCTKMSSQESISANARYYLENDSDGENLDCDDTFFTKFNLILIGGGIGVVLGYGILLCIFRRPRRDPNPRPDLPDGPPSNQNNNVININISGHTQGLQQNADTEHHEMSSVKEFKVGNRKSKTSVN